ncbi:hypothetical protein K7W03_27300 [Sphingobium sp. PNB]|uniref:hypothetical protein n=1 Tax=Sphingobium sp. PNB TaxID=863934 RepID=UPI001CA42FBD|nr:hypothetical protein [Sphingobium sp. PNB]MCB4863283.1 hypothetical protein [Sphingobium sp. PNB]
MANMDLNELISEEHLGAFAAMWPQEQEAAAAEVRQLLELVTRPTEHLTKTQAFARRLLLGLVGDEPDIAIWMQAVAASGLQLRPEHQYVVLRDRQKPGRYIERGLRTYFDGVDARQQRAGITDEGVKQGMHLVAFLLLAKEFKNIASGPAALGPAWPLMVAVDSYLSNDEKRALYAAGADAKLQRALADALKGVLAEDASCQSGAGTSSASRAANWRRELPPKTNLERYFEAKRAGRSTDNRETDLITVEEMILSGPRPSFLPADVDRCWPSRSKLPTRFNVLLPQKSDEYETFLKAMRAIARRNSREHAIRTEAPEVYSTDFKVQVWLRNWVGRGGGIARRSG